MVSNCLLSSSSSSCNSDSSAIPCSSPSSLVLFLLFLERRDAGWRARDEEERLGRERKTNVQTEREDERTELAMKDKWTDWREDRSYTQRKRRWREMSTSVKEQEEIRKEKKNLRCMYTWKDVFKNVCPRKERTRNFDEGKDLGRGKHTNKICLLLLWFYSFHCD